MLEQEFLPLHSVLVIRGFLNYVVRMYTWLNPYIKGLHLTINSWRPGRETSGFKLKGKDLEHAMATWAKSRGTLCRWVDVGLDIMYRRVRLQSRSKGWLFEANPGKRAKFGWYQEYFKTLIDLAREREHRLLLGLVSTNNFSLWRSPRRGAVLETMNNNVDVKVIELSTVGTRRRQQEALRQGYP
jgi:hypothetical protein